MFFIIDMFSFLGLITYLDDKYVGYKKI
jgi:hypothetical protein